MMSGIILLAVAFVVVFTMVAMAAEIVKRGIRIEKLMQEYEHIHGNAVRLADESAEYYHKMQKAESENLQLKRMLADERTAGYTLWRKHEMRIWSLKNRMDTIYSYQKQINDLRMQKMEAEYVAKNAACAVYCVMDMVVRRLRNNVRNRTESIYSYQRQIEELRMQKMEVESELKEVKERYDADVLLFSGLRYKVADLEQENMQLREQL